MNTTLAKVNICRNDSMDPCGRDQETLLWPSCYKCAASLIMREKGAGSRSRTSCEMVAGNYQSAVIRLGETEELSSVEGGLKEHNEMQCGILCLEQKKDVKRKND